MTHATPVLLCLAVSACSQSRIEPQTSADNNAQPAVEATAALTTTTPVAPSLAPVVDTHNHAYTAEIEVLDVLDNRVLRGVALEAPPDSDAMLTYTLLLELDGEPVGLPPELSPALNALLLPNDQLVVATRAGELVVTDLRTTRVLDAPVERSLDVSADGRHVAYMRGDEMPFYDLYAVDVASGQKTQLTSNRMPVWSPAFSLDGTRVVFAAASTGVPAVYTVGRDGSALRQHTNIDVTNVGGQPSRPLDWAPTGPRAPLWSPGFFVFEGEEGVVALNEAGVLLWHRPQLARPRWHERGISVAVQTRGAPGTETIISIATGNAEAAP